MNASFCRCSADGMGPGDDPSNSMISCSTALTADRLRLTARRGGRGGAGVWEVGWLRRRTRRLLQISAGRVAKRWTGSTAWPAQASACSPQGFHKCFCLAVLPRGAGSTPNSGTLSASSKPVAPRRLDLAGKGRVAWARTHAQNAPAAGWPGAPAAPPPPFTAGHAGGRGQARGRALPRRAPGAAAAAGAFHCGTPVGRA